MNVNSGICDHFLDKVWAKLVAWLSPGGGVRSTDAVAVSIYIRSL